MELDLIDMLAAWRTFFKDQSPYVPGNNYIEVLVNRWRMYGGVFAQRKVIMAHFV